jgi:hypothetical protein
MSIETSGFCAFGPLQHFAGSPILGPIVVCEAAFVLGCSPTELAQSCSTKLSTWNCESLNLPWDSAICFRVTSVTHGAEL